jgi:uncharacterized protein
MSSDPPPEPRPSSRPPGPPPMNALAASGWALGAMILFYALAITLVRLRPGSEYDVVSGVGCQAIAYLAALFLILRTHAPESGIRHFVGARPTHGGFYLLAVLLGVALEAPANTLYDLLERLSGDTTKDRLPEIFHDAAPARRALISLAVILFGPMLEEILFRGALFRPMMKSHPPRVVIVVTATLFAIAHPSPTMYLPIFLLGLALGLLRRASGSLGPSMLLHVTFNAIPFYVMAGGMPDIPLPLWLVLSSTAVALALLGGVHLLGIRSAAAGVAREYDEQ